MIEPLTEREQEIAGLIAEGLHNREIAEKLFLEVSTVETHVHHILRKIDARSRGDIIRYVYSGGAERDKSMISWMSTYEPPTYALAALD